MLLDLFLTFLLVGLVSFGGGYAMIPVIERHVVHDHAWMTAQQFSDAITIAGMSPGPVATNCAIYIGYHMAGMWGAIISTIGIIIPSLLIVIIAASLFYKVHKTRLMKSAFYGLRPVIAGLIIYAAIGLAQKNGLIAEPSWHMLSLILIFLLSLYALARLKMHPLSVILLSGLVGISLYG